MPSRVSDSGDAKYGTKTVGWSDKSSASHSLHRRLSLTLVVLANAGQVNNLLDSGLLEDIFCSNAGSFEYTRRAEGARGDDYELLRADCSYLILVCVGLEDGIRSILDADGALASGTEELVSGKDEVPSYALTRRSPASQRFRAGSRGPYSEGGCTNNGEPHRNACRSPRR